MSKTILVTRAKGDEREIAEALQALGHHVIHEPLTEIFLDHTVAQPLAQFLHDQEPDAILITSKHAAIALALLSEIRDISVLAVGSATAEVLESHGFTRVHEAGGTLASMIDTIRESYDEDARFLYVSGEHIRSDLPDILASFGMECVRIVAYSAIAATELSETLIEQIRRGQIDAVTLFSPRNAQIFCSLLKEAGCAEHASNMALVALSEEVANAADALAFGEILIAAEPTLASLIERVDNGL